MTHLLESALRILFIVIALYVLGVWCLDKFVSQPPGIGPFAFSQKLEWLINSKSKLAIMVETDLTNILHSNNNFAVQWKKVSKIDLRFDSVVAKSSLLKSVETTSPINLPLNTKGPYYSEFQFFDDNTTIDKITNENLVILQISIIDSQTQNKLFEFSRSYPAGEILTQIRGSETGTQTAQ